MTVMKDDYRNHCSAWTLRELNIVESCYGKESTTGIARRLGRTAVAVRQKAVALGLGLGLGLGGASIYWSRQEEGVLRNEYARGEGISHVMTLLPGRTKKTIYQKSKNAGDHQRTALGARGMPYTGGKLPQQRDVDGGFTGQDAGSDKN